MYSQSGVLTRARSLTEKRLSSQWHLCATRALTYSHLENHGDCFRDVIDGYLNLYLLVTEYAPLPYLSGRVYLVSFFMIFLKSSGVVYITGY